MTSNVPTSVPVYTDLVNDQDWVLALHPNRLQDDVTALANLIGMIGKAQSWATDFATYMKNQKVPIVTKKDADEFYVSAGAIWVANSGGTVKLPRRNTAVTTCSASNIDTGSMAVGMYYVYVVADTAANTFTVKFSASATAPTGLTNYELIGWFYNETVGVLDITSGYIGNITRFGVENVLNVINNTDTSVTGDTSYHDGSPTIKFYAPSRIISIKSSIQIYQGAVNEQGQFCWSVDGSDQTTYAPIIKDNNGGGSAFPWAMQVDWKGAIAADVCTLIPRVKTLSAGYTTHMFNKIITIKEEPR